MIGKLVGTLIGFNVLATFSTVWDHVDIWAPAANTALLIALAMLQRRTGQKVDEAHESIHATARTAASAAECAETAARIAKELGGTLRAGDPIQAPLQEQP